MILFSCRSLPPPPAAATVMTASRTLAKSLTTWPNLKCFCGPSTDIVHLNWWNLSQPVSPSSFHHSSSFFFCSSTMRNTEERSRGASPSTDTSGASEKDGHKPAAASRWVSVVRRLWQRARRNPADVFFVKQLERRWLPCPGSRLAPRSDVRVKPSAL